MKKLYFLIAILLLAFTLSSEAGKISEDQARKAAVSVMYERSNLFGQPMTVPEIKVISVHVESVNNEPVYYVFQFERGFAIIAADDRHDPVIGYALRGVFKWEDAPESYRNFMKSYANQITFIRENNIEAPAEITGRWTELLSDDFAALAAQRDLRDVEPLVDNLWNQDNPYNVMCPEDPAGPGGRTYVGCVATAMSMIMYYYRYPETGTGQHCYIPGNLSYGQQCADYANTQYQWNGMKNTIDNKNPFPIGEIQYHCAVSVNMNFSPNGSGSHSYLVPGALNQYFRYNNAQYLEKSNYQHATWINMLKDEIDLGRPLYYSGYDATTGGGHAFVCDGYQGDNFHFNFGWSGYSNGFYSLYSVGGYSNGQGCVRFFYPTGPGYPGHVTGTVTLTHRSGSFTDGSGPIDDYLNNTSATWIIDPQTPQDSVTQITLDFLNFDIDPSDTVKIFDGAATDSPLLGAFTGSNLPPTVISSGNKLCILFATDGSMNGEGFYAEYSSTSPVWCQGMTSYTEATGSFNDGSGTFNYQGGSTCMWNIAPPNANKITLYFDAFETEDDIDLIKVFDGSTLIAQFSGNEIPDPVEATSGSMFVTFTTNQFNHFAGWEAYYETDNVGIRENDDPAELNVYPNPVAGEMNILFEVKEEGDLRIEILNATGQVVYSEVTGSMKGTFHRLINTGHWAGGLYVIKMQQDGVTTDRKVVVK